MSDKDNLIKEFHRLSGANKINESSDDISGSVNVLATYIGNIDKSIDSNLIYDVIVANPQLLKFLMVDGDNVVAVLTIMNTLIKSNDEGLNKRLGDILNNI